MKWKTIANLEGPKGLRCEVTCLPLRTGPKYSVFLGVETKRKDEEGTYVRRNIPMEQIDDVIAILAEAKVAQEEDFAWRTESAFWQDVDRIERDEKHMGGQNKIGAGLGRFSKPGKTARKRQKSSI